MIITKHCANHNNHSKIIKILESRICDIHTHTKIMNGEFGDIKNDIKKILFILEGDGTDNTPGLVMKVDRLKRDYKTNISWIKGLLTLLALPLLFLIITYLIK